MSELHKQVERLGYNVRRLDAGDHTLGQVDAEGVTVIFKDDGGGSGGGSGSTSCLSCKISHISECANLVCPDIKKHDPQASCADAIKECMALACRGSCSGLLGGVGDVLVIA